MNDTDILIGDCRETLKTLPSGSVQCCVTSPPYFGLRDYGVDGQLGLEPTPDAFVAQLVAVFREVRRVLRDDGTLWLNLGDSYASTGSGRQGAGGQRAGRRHTQERLIRHPSSQAKQMLGIPWRVAFALQADGWYLRQDIIWHKPNPMPESVKDRCTKAHEYIFLLSKSPRYFFDAEAMKEPAVRAGDVPGGKGRYIQHSAGGHNKDGLSACGKRPVPERRNRRTVWSVSARPYKGAHFATFPPELITPCILAGSRPGDTVLDPFGGSGTTAGVATSLGRKAVLCELNPEYADLVPDRIAAIHKAALRSLLS